MIPISLTFDVDAEAGWLGEGERVRPPADHPLRGPLRRRPRTAAASSTCCAATTSRRRSSCPGYTAELHPDTVLDDPATAGHEIGHHGYLHLRSDKVPAPRAAGGDRARLRGARAAGAPRPRGYRSTVVGADAGDVRRCWWSTGSPTTRSCMGDDRPYCRDAGRTADPRAAGALVARRLAALRLEHRRRRQRRRPGRAVRVLAGRVRAARAERPAHQLHDAPRGDRPRPTASSSSSGWSSEHRRSRRRVVRPRSTRSPSTSAPRLEVAS